MALLQRNVFVPLISMVFLLATSVAGQDSPKPVNGEKQTSRDAQAEPTPPTDPPPAESDTPKKKPPAQLPGPKMLDLRYNEHFSYLDADPGSYRSDFFDPIKNIHLDDDWILDVGGEVRGRFEYHGNFAFGARTPGHDSFFLYRFLAHADLQYRDVFRFFIQGASVWEDGREFGPRVIDENKAALQQLFIDFKALGGGEPLTIRLGRQDLSYGAQRFVSPLDWANTRRRFDAAKAVWQEKTWQLDAFWSRPVLVRRTKFDNWAENVDFFGVYWTYRGNPNLGFDVFGFGNRNSGNPINPNGGAGDHTRYTIGGRLHGKARGFDYDAVLAGQWGSWGGDSIRAWAGVLDGGYTIAPLPWKPRVGVGLDWATGDRDPGDGTVETFDQLYPLGHKYLGFMDFIGRQNILAANLNLSAWPIANKLKARAAFHAFWLDSKEDALYNAAGAPTRRDPFGNSGREVGQELDLTLLCLIDVHQSVLVGYSHFFPGNFISNTGPSNDADFVYVQYRLKF